MSKVAERLTELRELKELRTLEAEVAQLESVERRDKLLEAGQVIGSRTGYLNDHPGFGFGPSSPDGVFGVYHVDRLDDRMDGRYRPVYETETQLSEQRGISRVLSSVDEHAIGIIDTLANYTLFKGFIYEFAPTSPEFEQDAAAAQEVIDEFTERTHWRRREREFHERSRRDGEPFLKIKPIGSGASDIEFVEPAAITEPTNPNDVSEYAGFAALDWSFGVGTDFGDQARVHGYFRDMTGDQQDWEYIPRSRMIHGKRNVDQVAKRGVSDFYGVWRNIERAAKVLRNSGEGAALQSAIAWIREHVVGTTLTDVQNLSSGKQIATFDQSWPSGNSTTTRFQQYQPGTIIDVPSGQQYKPGPMGSERNQGFSTIVNAILGSAAVRWSMPKMLVTGDASETNFASSLTAESPFVRSIEASQAWYSEEFAEVMWAILAIAINTDRTFGARGIVSIADLKRRINLDIQAPRVSVRNRIEDTQISEVLHRSRLLSGRTWSGQEELDYDAEQAQIAEEPQPQPQSQFGTSPSYLLGDRPPAGARLPNSQSGQGEQPQPLRRLVGRVSESFWGDYP